jgi:tetratricopeptide (TPR) repeat protein
MQTPTTKWPAGLRVVAISLFVTTLLVCQGWAADTFKDLATRADEARLGGRLIEAVRLYREALQLDPEWEEGLWYLGTTLYDLNRYEEAIPPFRQLASMVRQGPAVALLGLCEFQVRDYERALLDLQKARLLGLGENEQLRSVVRYHAAILLNRFEQYEAAFEALAPFARARQRTPSVVEAFGLSTLRMPYLPTEVPPDHRELVLMAGRATYEAAAYEFQRAGELYRRMVERYPDRLNVNYAYGVFLMTRDRREEGMGYLRKELELHPDNVAALLQIVFEYIDRGDSGEGLEYARKAAELDPGAFAPHHALGRILLDEGKTDEAIPELEAAVRLEPGSPEARFALARAYQRVGRREDAARERAEFNRLNKERDRLRKGLEGLASGESPRP